MGENSCVCEIGKAGSNCQFTYIEHLNLLEINEQIMTTLETDYLINLKHISNLDVEYIVHVLRGLLKNPDVFPGQRFVDVAVDLIEKCSHLSFYEYKAFETYVKNCYFETLSRLVDRVMLEHKLKNSGITDEVRGMSPGDVKEMVKDE
jgi:hypothetical protein